MPGEEEDDIFLKRFDISRIVIYLLSLSYTKRINIQYITRENTCKGFAN